MPARRSRLLGAGPCLLFVLSSWVLIHYIRMLADAWLGEQELYGAPSLAVWLGVDCSLIIAVFAYLRRTEPESLRVGVGLRLASWRTVLVAVALGFVLAVYPLAYFILAVPPRVSGDVTLTLVVVAVFLGPPVEELMYRGYLWAGFCASWGWLPAALVTTGFFLLAHIDQLDYPNPGGGSRRLLLLRRRAEPSPLERLAASWHGTSRRLRRDTSERDLLARPPTGLGGVCGPVRACGSKAVGRDRRFERRLPSLGLARRPGAKGVRPEVR